MASVTIYCTNPECRQAMAYDTKSQANALQCPRCGSYLPLHTIGDLDPYTAKTENLAGDVSPPPRPKPKPKPKVVVAQPEEEDDDVSPASWPWILLGVGLTFVGILLIELVLQNGVAQTIGLVSNRRAGIPDDADTEKLKRDLEQVRGEADRIRAEAAREIELAQDSKVETSKLKELIEFEKNDGITKLDELKKSFAMREEELNKEISLLKGDLLDSKSEIAKLKNGTPIVKKGDTTPKVGPTVAPKSTDSVQFRPELFPEIAVGEVKKTMAIPFEVKSLLVINAELLRQKSTHPISVKLETGGEVVATMGAVGDAEKVLRISATGKELTVDSTTNLSRTDRREAWKILRNLLIKLQGEKSADAIYVFLRAPVQLDPIALQFAPSSTGERETTKNASIWLYDEYVRTIPTKDESLFLSTLPGLTIREVACQTSDSTPPARTNMASPNRLKSDPKDSGFEIEATITKDQSIQVSLRAYGKGGTSSRKDPLPQPPVRRSSETVFEFEQRKMDHTARVTAQKRGYPVAPVRIVPAPQVIEIQVIAEIETGIFAKVIQLGNPLPPLVAPSKGGTGSPTDPPDPTRPGPMGLEPPKLKGDETSPGGLFDPDDFGKKGPPLPKSKKDFKGLGGSTPNPKDPFENKKK